MAERLNPNRTGLFYMFRFAPPVIFVVCGAIATKFVLRLTIKALAQVWKNLHKINDVIDSDVIILRNCAENLDVVFD